MKQDEALEVLLSGKNCFLTGKAGTGKSYLTEQFISELRSKNKTVIVTAPTGIAAINVGGATIHSTFIVYGYYPHQNWYKKQKVRWRDVKTLIIDEISMVWPDLLDQINYTLQEERRSIRPFGWLQVILVWDPEQIPPVYAIKTPWDAQVIQLLMNKYGPVLTFEQSLAFQNGEFETLELDEVKRQTDPRFIDLLNKVRDWDLSVLSQFQTWYGSAHTVHLRPYNKMVDSFNARCLANIKWRSKIYRGQIIDDFNVNNCITPLMLELKEGARIVVTANVKEHGVVNGDLGTVLKLKDESIIIEIDRYPDTKIELANHEWQQRDYDGIDEVITGVFKQIPVKLAWAMTIHKSQGLSLESVCLTITKDMTRQMIYVWLSRCKSFEGLFVNRI